MLLLAVFGLLVLGIAASGMSFYAQRKASLKERTLNELSAIAELKVREISAWRRERVADARASVRNPFLARAMRDCLARPGDIRLRKQVEAWMRGFHEDYGYGNVLLLDRSGAVRAAVPDSFVVDPFLEQALPTGSDPLFSDFHRTGEDGQIVAKEFVDTLVEVGEIRPNGFVVQTPDPRDNAFE